jgi:hypothetical protein
MIDRVRIKGVRLAHPLRDQATLITFGDYTKMRDTGQRMSSIRDDPLPAQRMMRVTDDNLFSVTMGSMLCLCSGARQPSCAISGAIPIAWPSAITGCSPSMATTSRFNGRTMPTAINGAR